MIFEETRKILETRFFSGIPYDFEVFLEGRQNVQTTSGKDWVTMSIADAASTLNGYSKNSRKTSGTIRFNIYTKFGSGSKRVREIADRVNGVMSFTAGNDGIPNAGLMYVMAGSLRKRADDDSGYLNYIIDFAYDYHTS